MISETEIAIIAARKYESFLSVKQKKHKNHKIQMLLVGVRVVCQKHK